MLNSPFRRLWFANLAASGAEQLAVVSLPLIAVLALGAGAFDVGALGAAQTLPYLLLSLIAGLWADRWPRQMLMAGAEALRVLLVAVISLIALAEALNLTILAILGFGLSAATVMFNVAAQAYLPSVVQRESLASANARLEFARAATVFLGPGLTGAFAAWSSPVVALALSAATSILAVWALSDRSMRRDIIPSQRSSLATALSEGLVFVWREKLLRAIAACAMAWNFSWYVLMAVLVLFALQVQGLNTAELGIALGMQGGGMLLAALSAGWFAAHMPFGLMIVLGPVFSVLAAALLAISTVATGMPALVLLCGVFFLFGYGPMLWTVGQTTLRQAIVPASLIGRVSAVQQMANLGMRPIGALVGGWVGGSYGLTAAIWLAIIGYGVQLVVILASQVPALRGLPEAREEAA